MLGEIDYTKKPRSIKLSLCNPQMQKIASLSDAYNIRRAPRLNSIGELEFDIPYEKDVRHSFIKNKNAQQLRMQYLIRADLGHSGDKEYYVINVVTDAASDTESKHIHSYALGYELSNKSIRNYEVTSKNPTEVFTDALGDTLWDIEYIDPYFDEQYRSYNETSIKVLEFIEKVASNLNGVILWDTENRKISLVKPENTGDNFGLSVKHGKLMKSVDQTQSTDEMATILKPYGKDGLTIHGVNPTGSGTIENFSYFMQPFKRDANRNVIQSSDYMPDDLCHAILDYQEKIESNKPTFESLMDDLTLLQEEKTVLENEKADSTTTLYQVQDRVDIQKASGQSRIHTFNYNNGAVSNDSYINNSERDYDEPENGNKTLIFYSPHQDDETLFAGVSIMNHLADGYDVHVVLVTDGKASGARNKLNGSWYCNWHNKYHSPSKENYGDGTVSETEFRNARDTEFRASLKELGVKDSNVHIASSRYADGTLTVAEAKSVIQSYASQYPEARHMSMTYSDVHPDHAACGTALLQLKDAGTIDDVRWIVKIEEQSFTPGVYEDIRSVDKTKLAKAIAHYKTWNPTNKSYGVGYHSVPALFDILEKEKKSKYHL